MKSLHISLNTAHSGYIYPCHLHISTGRHPIVHTLTLQMPKPPYFVMPCHTLYTQKTVKSTLHFSILQRHLSHFAHPSSLRSLQTMQIFSLHRPRFSPIRQHTLDTSSVYIFLFMWYDVPYLYNYGSISFEDSNFQKLAQII